MNICLIGNNLTSLIVSKILINNGAKIDFLSLKDINTIYQTELLVFQRVILIL